MKFLIIGKPEYTKDFTKQHDQASYFILDSTQEDRLNLNSELSNFLHSCSNEHIDLKIVALPSGSVYKNTSSVARVIEDIRINFPELNIYIFGPSKDFAEIIDNKFKTHQLFKQQKIAGALGVQEIDSFVTQSHYPVLIKHKSTSGGREMLLINTDKEFRSWLSLNNDRTELFYTEPFVNGIEISQSVLKFGTKIYALPQTVKPPTSPDELRHSDQKPKFCGFFSQNTTAQDSVIAIANEKMEAGILAGQFICKSTSDTVIAPIEIESRLTGSTPIMTSAANFDIYEKIHTNISNQNESSLGFHIETLAPRRYSVQYISFSDKAHSSIDLEGVYQIKIEDHPANPKPRCRINFAHRSLDEVFLLAQEIGKKINDPAFFSTIKKGYEEINHYS